MPVGRGGEGGGRWERNVHRKAVLKDERGDRERAWSCEYADTKVNLTCPKSEWKSGCKTGLGIGTRPQGIGGFRGWG